MGKRFYVAVFLCICILPMLAVTAVGSVKGAGDNRDAVLNIMADELQREMAVLSKQDPPPYYVSYSITDSASTMISATFGALTYCEDSKDRELSVMVRVGDYQLDSTHALRGDHSDNRAETKSASEISIDNNEAAIRNAIWQKTDYEYKAAVERYSKVKADVSVRIEAEDESADFSKEPAPHADYIEPAIAPISVPKQLWENRVKQYSSTFLGDAAILSASSDFTFEISRKYLVTTEGARLVQNETYSHLRVFAYCKAADGMNLPMELNYSATTPEALPSHEKVAQDVESMLSKLKRLRVAPMVDPYTGPAILSGKAAGVFLHEVFGHRVEGHRQKSEEEGQTFKKKIGQAVLPKSISILFDPTRKEYRGQELMGYYRYDDEGIKGQPVHAIEKGVLRDFLMCRSPFEGFPRSNGHGRGVAGTIPVARQSNLILETSAPASDGELREQLISECKTQGKEYGLLFADIEGGSTYTGRDSANSFNVSPLEVYRIYADGRPDELVRGVDLVGTPLVMFSMIATAGDTPEVFNGVCGAESGDIPVAAVSPALLIRQVEVQRKGKSQERPPLLPRPDMDQEVTK